MALTKFGHIICYLSFISQMELLAVGAGVGLITALYNKYTDPVDESASSDKTSADVQESTDVNGRPPVMATNIYPNTAYNPMIPLQPPLVNAPPGYGQRDLSWNLGPYQAGELPTLQSVYGDPDTDPRGVRWNDNQYLTSQVIDPQWQPEPMMAADQFNDRPPEDFDSTTFQGMNTLTYPDGILPNSYGAFDGNSLRPENLDAYLFKPPKREVTQAMMRMPPQVQPNTHGTGSVYLENHDRALEATKLASAKGALDYYVPEPVTVVKKDADGNDVQVTEYRIIDGGSDARGQYTTERTGGFHPRERVFPIIPAKQGIQATFRLGNPSNAVGKLGSEFSQDTGPLGEMRMPRNASVSEYERVAFPTSAPVSLQARVGQVVLKDQQRDTTTVPWTGQVNQGSKNQEALRLEKQYVKPKNVTDFQVVLAPGTRANDKGAYQNVQFDLALNSRNFVSDVGSENVSQPGTRANDKGAYQNVEFDLKVLNRNLTMQDSIHVQQPGTQANDKGAYQNVEFDLKVLNRNLSQRDSIHIQQPGTKAGEKGGYQNVEFDLKVLNKNLTMRDSIHVQQPGRQGNEKGAYQNIDVDLSATNRMTTTMDSSHVQQAGSQAYDRGAYQNIDVDVLALNRDTTGNAQMIGAPHMDKIGSYANVEVDLDMTNRASYSGKEEKVRAAYNPTKGTNAAYGMDVTDRPTNRSTVGYEDGRAANPVLASNSVADWNMDERINNNEARYTKKYDLISTIDTWAPMTNRTGAVQYDPHYPTSEVRRVVPNIVNYVNTSLIDAYRSNPYTLKITNDPSPQQRMQSVLY